MTISAISRFRRIALGCLLLALAVAQVAHSQVSSPRSGLKTKRGLQSRRKTITSLSFVLIVGRQGVGLKAQQWSSVFEKLNVSLRIRSGTIADKAETRETKTGKFRRVTVTGKLDRSGKIVFEKRSFSPADTDKLAEWIRELKAYGAQGAPAGKPLWGLTKAQFGAVYSGLSQEVETDVAGKPLKTAVLLMKAPASLPVRFSVDAEKWLQVRFTRSSAVRYKIKSHSFGTALAIVLHDYGLGFRPLRTPGGSIELVVDPKSIAPDVWPIGWEPKTLRSKIAPKLYKMVPVELKDVKLTDVLHAVSLKTGVPVHLDHSGIEAARIDVENLKVSYARRKASWSVLIRGVTVPHKLTRKFRIDELGRPFVWIQPLSPRRRTR